MKVMGFSFSWLSASVILSLDRDCVKKIIEHVVCANNQQEETYMLASFPSTFR